MNVNKFWSKPTTTTTTGQSQELEQGKFDYILDSESIFRFLMPTNKRFS